MLVESFVTKGMTARVSGSLHTPGFHDRFLKEVVTEVFGVEEPQNRPAEYAIVPPIELLYSPKYAVHVRLSGVSTHGRPLKALHGAAKALHNLVKDMIARRLKAEDDPIQVFCYIQVDNPVETWPGSGVLGNLIEHPAEWVTSAGASQDDDLPYLG